MIERYQTPNERCAPVCAAVVSPSHEGLIAVCEGTSACEGGGADLQRRDEALLLDAWLADNHAGLDALMLAPTRALVADLKDAARAARLNGAQPGRETALSDGNRVSRGDVIITRRNNRTLTSGAAWVHNGDRWRITSVHRDGAQGVTADTCHGLLTGTESRQQAYTMLSRGRNANHAWVQVSDVDHHTAPVAQNLLEPSTATQLLESVVERDDAPVSVTTLLGPAVTCYLDAIGFAAERHLDQAIRRTRLPHHQLHQARSCPNEHLGSDHTQRPGSSPTS
jgi:hypothetical protein